MGVFQRMLSTQALMFIYMLVGVIIVRAGILKPEGRPAFIGLLINVTLPCMILHAFVQDAGLEALIVGGRMLVISACCVLSAWGLGRLIWRNRPPMRRAVLEFATMFSNAGNAGLPIISLVFGAQGVLYASFFLIPIRVLMWTVGISLFVGDNPSTPRWKTLLLNPSLLAVFIGIPLMLTGLKLPEFISTAIGSIGAMTGPLSMMIIGASLANAHPRDMLDGDAWLLSGLRLAGLPLALMAVLRLIGVETLTWQVAVTLTAMPAAANTAILSEMYGCDYTFAARCVVVSTVLSLVTVPMLALLY